MAKANNKTVETKGSVPEFLSSIPDSGKRADSQKIIDMMQKISGESPKMWGPSIVGFGNYHYKYESGREGDFLKMGFSPRTQNLTIYIMPGFERYDAYMFLSLVAKVRLAQIVDPLFTAVAKLPKTLIPSKSAD